MDIAGENRSVKFLLLIHGDAAAEAAMTDDERRAMVDQHLAYGRYLSERGARIASEALGGFYVLEAGSIEEAAELVRPVPRSPGFVAELLPIVDM